MQQMGCGVIPGYISSAVPVYLSGYLVAGLETAAGCKSMMDYTFRRWGP
jgi:hypothetical protein